MNVVLVINGEWDFDSLFVECCFTLKAFAIYRVIIYVSVFQYYHVIQMMQ